MSTAVASVRANAGNVRRIVPDWVWAVLGLALALLYPYILDQTVSSPDDLLDASIQTLAYIIMALGLNIVVGFAGLLDLGYVAFYAIGAFVMGWLGSSQFPNVAKCGKGAGPNCHDGLHVLVSKAADLQPGIHLNFVLIVVI